MTPRLTKEQILKTLSVHRRKEIPLEEHPGFTRASVLIPLFPKEKELHVLLTVRTNEVESHKGQISFPGGMQDGTDRDAVHTALREAEEELGLHPRNITVLGLLSDFPVISRFIVTPVVGYMDRQPLMRPNPMEVDEVFSVPVSFFQNEASGRSQLLVRNGVSYTVWFYDYGKYTVWGATAAIMRDFVGVVSGK
jgi:8-oxo-dGTP pyrophosphatase MutT (NUDIX family)